MNPVIVEALKKYIKPPDTSGMRQAGRPKKARLRKRSKFVNPVKESTVRCSICNERDHNALTCYARRQNTASTSNEAINLLL